MGNARRSITNDEGQMTKETAMTNDETCQPRLPVLRNFSEGGFGHSDFGMDSSFVIPCRSALAFWFVSDGGEA
jgi:hypothetical protein